MSPPVHTIRSFCKIKVVSQYQLSEGILDFLPLQLPCTHTHTHRHVRTTTTNTCTCVASSLPSVSYWAHALSLSLSVSCSFRRLVLYKPVAHIQFCAFPLPLILSYSPASFLFISNWYLVLTHVWSKSLSLSIVIKPQQHRKMLYAILICIKSCFVCVLQTVSFLIFSNTIFGKKYKQFAQHNMAAVLVFG